MLRNAEQKEEGGDDDDDISFELDSQFKGKRVMYT